MKLLTTALASIFFATIAFSQSTTAPATAPADEFVQQATVFVKAMRFSDADKTERVTKLTADYLRQLRHILNQRQETLDKLGKSQESAEINTRTSEAWVICRNSSVALRDAYVTQLNALMTPTQVERIKDGITTDWFHIVLQSYDEMVPNLTYAQRAHVVGLLTEMRENTMLELGVGPQEKWVDKYKGIINNYISRQGYDFTALSKSYDAKRNEKKQP